MIFPEKVFEQHIIALGKTGAGKSSALTSALFRLLSLRAYCSWAQDCWEWELELSCGPRGMHRELRREWQSRRLAAKEPR